MNYSNIDVKELKISDLAQQTPTERITFILFYIIRRDKSF